MKTNYLSLIVLLSLTLFSCQNFNGLNPPETANNLTLKSAEIAVNDMMVESVVEEINYDAEFYSESEKLLRQLSRFKGGKNLLGGHQGMRYMAGQAPNVSIDTSETGYPVIITLDYGDATELNNGRVISGVVTVEISAECGTDGATRSITYDNCVIDSVAVDGICSKTFNGDNETTRVITSNSNVTFILADGTVITRSGTHVRNWLQGLDTPMEHDDDMIEITGSLEASTLDGDSWNRDIVTPLLRLGDCRYNVQGVVQFSQNGILISTLDFGDGECDNLAVLTVDGETIEIELSGRRPKANVNEHHQNRKNNKNN